MGGSVFTWKRVLRSWFSLKFIFIVNFVSVAIMIFVGKDWFFEN